VECTASITGESFDGGNADGSELREWRVTPGVDSLLKINMIFVDFFMSIFDGRGVKYCEDFFVGRKCVYSLGCKNKEHQCCLDEISWLQCAPTCVC
jgi:hypothetical protein